MQKFNTAKIVQMIVKLYFVGAVAGSFAHIITAASKIGLTGWEMWSTPFMIDGLAVIGLVMRGTQFSQATNKIGFRVQVTAGMLSLAANVFAAHNLGGRIYGVAIVVLFLAAEWLSDKIESAEVDRQRETAAKRQAAARKAAATRKRKATQRKREAKVLEEMLNR
jgi:hypothetical protein